MPYKPIPSTTLTAAVRSYLGLSQLELAVCLGVTRGQVAHVEAGRRLLTGEASRRLSQLARVLPLDAPAALAADDTAEVPAVAPLRRRLAKCRWQLANLRAELAEAETRVAQARRWQQVLPALRAVLPAPAAADAHATRQHQLLDERAGISSAVLAADEAAVRVLLTLRIQALETEVAALRGMVEIPAAENESPIN